MSLIKRSNELEIQQCVKMMVYGQAGTGKTTLALSSPKPLLLDFDNGVKRVNTAHLDDSVGIVQVNSWQEIMDLLNYNGDELREFDTIVVDTIGKMIDFIIAYRCGGRNPQIKDWGTINNDFKWFTSSLSLLNKNIVFVAHRDTRKEGDNVVFIPALREKNYNSIITELDLLGYLEMRSENGRQIRTITFSPTSRNDGKNTCQLPDVLNIPVIIDANGQSTAPNDFVQKNIINKYNKMIEEKEAKVKAYNAVLEEIKNGIEQITDAQGANHFTAHIKDYANQGNSVIIYARNLFSQKVKDLGLEYDKDTKQYKAKE